MSDLGSNGLGADVLDQVGDDVEVDVGFEQGHADFAQGFGDVLFSERALAAEGLEGALEFVCEVLKHADLKSISGDAGAGWGTRRQGQMRGFFAALRMTEWVR